VACGQRDHHGRPAGLCCTGGGRGLKAVLTRLVSVVHARSNRSQHWRIEEARHGVAGLLVLALIDTGLAGLAPAASPADRRASTYSYHASGGTGPGGDGARERPGDHRRNHGSVAGGSPRDPRRDPVDLATASAQADQQSGCSRTRTRIRICFDNGRVAPVHCQCPRRCGRARGAPPRSAVSQRRCAGGSGTDSADGGPAGSSWPRAIAVIFSSRSAAPRARIDPLGGRPVTLTAVHPLAPMGGHAGIWQRELTLIGQAMAAVEEPQVVAGDFNASRDHRPFRDLLGMAFRDCADFSQSRSWPGFTWPAAGECSLSCALIMCWSHGQPRCT
jgi:hypothetical protein